MNTTYRIVQVLVAMAAVSMPLLSKPLDESSSKVDAHLLRGSRSIHTNKEGEVTHVEPGTRSLYVYVTNKTKNKIRMPTNFLSLSYRDTEAFFNITIDWDHPYDSAEYNFIIPESRIAVVELREAESVNLFFALSKKWPLIDKPIKLNMNIPAAICERYDIDYFNFQVNVQQ